MEKWVKNTLVVYRDFQKNDFGEKNASKNIFCSSGISKKGKY